MKNCLFITLILLLSMPAMVMAQATGGKNQPTEKLEEIATNNLAKNDTWNALDFYKQVYDRKPDDPKAIYDVAYTYYMLRDYPNAAEWFKKLVEKDTEQQFNLARWYYAYNLKLNGKYQECIPEFEKVISSYDGPDAETIKKLAQVEIDGAKWAQKVSEPYEELKINNVGKIVNSPLMENYAYPMGRDKIIYSSLRSDTVIIVEEAADSVKYARIYQAVLEDDNEEDDKPGEWAKAEYFHPEILNREGYHTVHPTFSPDKTKFFFGRAKLTGNIMENSKIYSCTYDGTSLGEALVLDFNDNEYSCKNPVVATIDGKDYLFFSSNMPGGQGRFDIWYAEINDDGTTRQPLNLGPTVNTVGDESYPFFDHRDNKLYFASTGHPGLGGFDLFTALRNPESGEWEKPENMGPGFNTSVDEFGFIINREGKDDCYGYFISNREETMTIKGKTSTDDIFSILMPERCDVELEILVLDKETGKPIDGATVKLVDKETGEVIAEQTNTEGNDFNFTLEQGKEYVAMTEKEGMEPTEELVVDARRPALEERFGSIDNPMSWQEETRLKETGLIVETFNKKTNEALNGVTVRVYNASTGDLVKEMTQDDSNKFEFQLNRDKDYDVKARLGGFLGDDKTVKRTEMSDPLKMYLTPPPLFVNVLFDFDKSNIREGAADTLNMVASILKEYPDLVVEVRGHTDAIGSNAYNDRLSKRRAKSAMRYLIKEHDIDKDRLIDKGFGEENPVAPNTTEDGEDNPAGRQLNRRVEFNIIEGSPVDGEKKEDETVGDATKDKTTNVAAIEEKKNR